ncbi:MAG TPA: nuclear transport factor 2 family protein [Spongiibacteraceae bacterium]|jgi:hypothetical protein
MNTTSNNIESLLAREAIRELKHRYFRALDTRDFDLLATCLTADIVIDYGPAGSYANRDNFMQMVCDFARTDTQRGLHFGLNCEIELLNSTEAIVQWVTHFVAFDPIVNRTLEQSGVYRDLCRKQAEHWLIATSRYELWFHKSNSMGQSTPLFPSSHHRS